MKPDILDRRWKYVPALETDVRATLDRVCPGWRERKPEAVRPATVREIKPRVRGKL